MVGKILGTLGIHNRSDLAPAFVFVAFGALLVWITVFGGRV